MKGAQVFEKDREISIPYILVILNSNLPHLGSKDQRNSPPLYNSPD